MSITISDVTPRVQYTAANTQTTFAVGFEFFTNADLKVFAGNTQLTFAATPANAAQYSVAGAGVSGGGSITLGGASTNGVIYTIFRDMAVARSTDFPTSGAFQIGSLNTELDKIIAMIQQVERDLKFSPKAAATTANTFNLTFPNLVANKILSVNSSGTALEFGQSTTDVATVAGIASDISALSAIASDIAAVENIKANITSVAGDATDIGAVAAKATEIGRLGTSDAVTDMNTLGTSAIVTDMDLLATSANVAAMGHLGTSANVTAMGLLGTSTVVTDLGILGTAAIVEDLAILGTNAVVADMEILSASAVVADMALLATTDVIADMALLATTDVIADMNTLATSDIISDLNAVEAIKANVSTVAANVAGVTSFAEKYRVGSTDPTASLNEGDLFYNSNTNVLKFYNGSAWITISSFASSNITGLTAETSIADTDLIMISDTSASGALKKMTKANFVTGLGSANAIADADGDTKIQVEESSDEDKVRFDTGGSERAVLDSNGIALSTNGGSFIHHNTIANDTTLANQNMLLVGNVAITGTLTIGANSTVVVI